MTTRTLLRPHEMPGGLELSQAIMELCMPGETQLERVQQATEMHLLMLRHNNQEHLTEEEMKRIFEFLPRLYRAHHYGVIDGRRIEVTVTARLGDPA